MYFRMDRSLQGCGTASTALRWRSRKKTTADQPETSFLVEQLLKKSSYESAFFLMERKTSPAAPEAMKSIVEGSGTGAMVVVKVPEPPPGVLKPVLLMMTPICEVLL